MGRRGSAAREWDDEMASRGKCEIAFCGPRLGFSHCLPVFSSSLAGRTNMYRTYIALHYMYLLFTYIYLQSRSAGPDSDSNPDPGSGSGSGVLGYCPAIINRAETTLHVRVGDTPECETDPVWGHSHVATSMVPSPSRTRSPVHTRHPLAPEVSLMIH